LNELFKPFPFDLIEQKRQNDGGGESYQRAYGPNSHRIKKYLPEISIQDYLSEILKPHPFAVKVSRIHVIILKGYGYPVHGKI
jgi:hypothetical protein